MLRSHTWDIFLWKKPHIKERQPCLLHLFIYEYMKRELQQSPASLDKVHFIRAVSSSESLLTWPVISPLLSNAHDDSQVTGTLMHIVRNNAHLIMHTMTQQIYTDIHSCVCYFDMLPYIKLDIVWQKHSYEHTNVQKALTEKQLANNCLVLAVLTLQSVYNYRVAQWKNSNLPKLTLKEEFDILKNSFMVMMRVRWLDWYHWGQ